MLQVQERWGVGGPRFVGSLGALDLSPFLVLNDLGVPGMMELLSGFKGMGKAHFDGIKRLPYKLRSSFVIVSYSWKLRERVSLS